MLTLLGTDPTAPITALPEAVWAQLGTLLEAATGSVWQLAIAVIAAVLMVALIGRLG